MADSYFQLNQGTGGDKADADSLTVNGQSVKRERDQIAGTVASAIAEVHAGGASGGIMALAVREAGTVGVTGTVGVAGTVDISGTVGVTGIVRLNAHRNLQVKQITVINGTNETTVLGAGASGVYHDLDAVLFTNPATGVFPQMYLREYSGATGNNALNLRMLDQDTEGVVFAIPWPQSVPASAWTVQVSTGITGFAVHILAHKAY